MARRTTRHRLPVAAVLVAGLAAALLLPSLRGVVRGSPDPAAPPSPTDAGAPEYVVLYAPATAPETARAAVAAAGGELLGENAAIGLAVVRAPAPDFLRRIGDQPALAGAARNRPIGHDPTLGLGPPVGAESVAGGVRQAGARLDGATEPYGRAAPGEVLDPARAPTAEPLAARQWDMAMIHATEQGAFATQQGRADVLVGVIDTGIDASHPDIAPNFDAGLSRNFTVDVPSVDGSCALDPDRSCEDPADVDENGHGTHVAGVIGAALNGVGIAGVAPGVRLVNLRAGQDSGYFFLKPTVDAITYAADHGIDVVNLSYFVDPWLFNCPDNTADSPAEQLEQRTIVAATQAAVDYAHERGVTLVAALGNEQIDLADPVFDPMSPDFPPFAARPRPVTNACLVVPAELDHVVGVVALGPGGTKADYSNWGVGEADLAAPGGFLGDFPGTSRFGQVSNMVLSAYPEAVGRRQGMIAANGEPVTPAVVRDCTAGTCRYWRYLEGTSMAAPHVVGVAALVVSQYGLDDPVHGGLTLAAGTVERHLAATAVDLGDERSNGIYGEGIVDAEAAVRAPLGQ